jgi:histidinol-phosphate aminotransferase
LFGIPYETQPLDENLCICKEDYYKENGGVVFPNPNAPTGVYMPLADIEDIIRHNRDVICIVDEAYIDFGGESALPLIEKYDNVLVVQTFSKSRSMAGARIGYAFGSERLIRYLNDAKYSFNSYTMDQLTLVNAVASLEDEEYFQETIRRIVTTRERMKKELSELGFTMPDSRSNFLFISHERVPARELFAMLRERHIYVRYFDKPRIDNMLRVTIGTDREMDQFIACLKEYLC